MTSSAIKFTLLALASQVVAQPISDISDELSVTDVAILSDESLITDAVILSDDLSSTDFAVPTDDMSVTDMAINSDEPAVTDDVLVSDGTEVTDVAEESNMSDSPLESSEPAAEGLGAGAGGTVVAPPTGAISNPFDSCTQANAAAGEFQITLAQCEADPTCVSSGSVTLTAASTEACYTAFNGGALVVDPGFIGAVQVVYTGVAEYEVEDAATLGAFVTINAGSSLAGAMVNGGYITMTSSGISQIKINDGNLKGDSITIDPQYEFGMNGGEVTLALTNAPTSVSHNDGELDLTCAGDINKVTSNGGELDIDQVGDTEKFEVNNGEVEITQVGTIASLQINGGSVELKSAQTTITNGEITRGSLDNSVGATITNLQNLGGSCTPTQNCPE